MDLDSRSLQDHAGSQQRVAGPYAAAAVADTLAFSALTISPATEPPKSLLDLPHDALVAILSLAMAAPLHGSWAVLRRGAIRGALRLSCRSFNQMVLAACTRIAWDGDGQAGAEAATSIPVQILAKCPLVTVLDMTGLRKPPSSFWGIPATLKIFRCWGACPPGKQKRAFPWLDLSPLSQLKQLETLDISYSHHRVTDLSPLAACKMLSNLYVSHCAIKDLYPLSSCKNLTELDCSHCHIADLSPLAACERLAHLECSKTKVVDLSPLAACKALDHLSCTNTLVRDLSPLVLCAQLRSVSCDSSVEGLRREYHLYGEDSDEEYVTYSHPALQGIQIDVYEDPSW